MIVNKGRQCVTNLKIHNKKKEVVLWEEKYYWCLWCRFSFLFTSFSYAADVIKLKFANYFPPTHMNSVMMGKYCEELNKKLAGKVEITQYTGSTLLSAPKIAAGVSTGIADIGLSNLAYTRGRFPSWR